MRSHEIALAALMLCAAMGAVRADPLLLEVWRNGVPTETVVPVTRAQDALLIPSADFPALGLNVTAPPGE